MRTAVVSVLALAFAGACTRHPDVIDPSDIAGRDVLVQTQPGVEERGTVSDGGRVIHTERGDFSLDEVTTITVTRRLRGALQGFGLGALIVGGSAAALAYASGDDKCGGEFCILEFTAGEKAALAGTAFGVIGGAVGLIVGALVGAHDVYDIGGSTQEPRIIPSGPPGSAAGLTVKF